MWVLGKFANVCCTNSKATVAYVNAVEECSRWTAQHTSGDDGLGFKIDSVAPAYLHEPSSFGVRWSIMYTVASKSLIKWTNFRKFFQMLPLCGMTMHVQFVWKTFNLIASSFYTVWHKLSNLNFLCSSHKSALFTCSYLVFNWSNCVKTRNNTTIHILICWIISLNIGSIYSNRSK